MGLLYTYLITSLGALSFLRPKTCACEKYINKQKQPTRECRVESTPTISHNILKNFKNVTFHVHVWNQHEKCIKMIQKPMFGPVVLDIACDTFINKATSLCSHCDRQEYKYKLYSQRLLPQ